MQSPAKQMNSTGAVEFINVPKNTIEPKDGGVTDRNVDEDAMASPRSFLASFESPANVSPSKPHLGHKQQSSPSISTIRRTLQSNRRLNQLQKNYAQTLLRKTSRLGRNSQS